MGNKIPKLAEDLPGFVLCELVSQLEFLELNWYLAY